MDQSKNSMTKQIPINKSRKNVDQWFSPEELDKERLKYEKMDPDLTTADNDFGSYAKVSRGNGIKGSSIEKHNLINCDIRVKFYYDLLGSRRFSTIADVGCGIGLTTTALSKIFNADKATGFDISQDAINYANQHSSRGIEYILKKVEPRKPLGGPYELVVAQEFYPFTRTRDLQTHLDYLESLMLSLTNPNGVLLIGLSDGTRESILNNIEEIASKVKIMDAKLSIHYLPNEKIFKITRSYLLSKLITKFVNLIINKNQFIVIKITKATK